MKGKRLASVFFLIAIVGLVGGLSWLIRMRFDSGEVYPRGSSFRPDPLGAKALFEAYSGIPTLTVTRNFTLFSQSRNMPEGAVVLFLNASKRTLLDLQKESQLHRFVEDGGRLFIGMSPRRGNSRDFNSSREKDSSEELEDLDELESEEDYSVSLSDDEVEPMMFDGLELAFGEHEGGSALRLTSDTTLPAELIWHQGSILELDPEYESWNTLYGVGDEVVAAERSLGAGKVIVFTDDFLFTNEALLKDRSSDLLVWVLGEHSQVIFDETHLGVVEQGGVAKLIRRYQLSGFVLILGFLFTLVAWRGWSALLPSYDREDMGNLVRAEQSTESGLADLIRRNIDAVDLPLEAFRAWKVSIVQSDADRTYWSSELEEIEILLTQYQEVIPRKRKPSELHLKIQTIINRKTRK